MLATLAPSVQAAVWVAVDEPRDRLTVEVGDARAPMFRPQMAVRRWNEVGFRLTAEEHPRAVVEEAHGLFRYITPNYEVHQYQKRGPDGQPAWEMEWVLPTRPRESVLWLTLENEGVQFWPQDPMRAIPEYVKGSLAVYHPTKGVFVDAAGWNYKCGKVGHLWRPLATDAQGRSVWCEFIVEPGRLGVRVPSAFLASATYPIVVDPTFGTTTNGGGGDVPIEGVIGMGRYSISEDGTGSSITAWLLNTSANSVAVKCNVYQDETGELDVDVAALANGQTEEKTVTNGANQEITFNFTAAPSFTSGTFYRLASWANGLAGGSIFNYNDNSVAENSTYVRSLTYGTWPDPSGTLTRTDDRRLSIYCTYTASGGSGNPWYYYAQQRERMKKRPWQRTGLLWTPSYALGKVA